MYSLEEAKKCISQEFKMFSEHFDSHFASDNAMLNEINKYILRKKGKQIRPIITLLAAKACGSVKQSTLSAATAIEMLHTASLIHDDVVDEADSRRGQKSVNAIWNNKVSILVGDYLLSKALITAETTDNLEIIKAISNVGRLLTEGELLQLENSKEGCLDENKYFEVIKKKTAVLFATACKVGAISVDSSDSEKIAKFGEIFGLCFQIKDDIFDYVSSEKEIGKPVGNDLREGKITLPLMYAIKQFADDKQQDMLRHISSKALSDTEIAEFIDLAKSKGGIEYAELKLKELKLEAEKELQFLPSSEAKDSLIGILDFTINRSL